jgi:hypothetical protein
MALYRPLALILLRKHLYVLSLLIGPVERLSSYCGKRGQKSRDTVSLKLHTLKEVLLSPD